MRITRNRLGLSILALLCAMAPLSAQAKLQTCDEKTTAALQAVITGEHRAEAEKVRDQYRHPVETLTWFGIRDDMTVVEMWPARGWYLNILAPYLKEKGVYYAAVFRNRDGFIKALAVKPELYDKIIVTQTPPESIEIAPPGSADMVLTFRNVHNWMAGGFAEAMFAAMYRALKPGGILGVVEHRGKPDVAQDPQARSGYVNEDSVVELAEAAGFQLIGRSDINANPKDTTDHPRGVWTLPPTLALDDMDRDKYQAIGESDRMTLKFGKPKN